MKIAKIILGTVLIILAAFSGWVYSVTFHPADIQAEPVSCPEDTPVLKANQDLKVMTWNVQYMAGKNYWFFYSNGPDYRPGKEDIKITLDEVARVIKAEKPHVVLLQEVDDGAARTDGEDQLAKLMERLPGLYPCHSSSFYWKASIIPKKELFYGPVGMKLSVISKYKINSATRRQIALLDTDNFIVQQFNLKRALQEVRLPVQDADGVAKKELTFLNTHLSAFAQGGNTMEKQVAQASRLLARFTKEGLPWILAGDFNLVPPGKAYNRLPDEMKSWYKTRTEIEPLFGLYQAIPSQADSDGPDYKKFFTHFSNVPKYKDVGPNKTIDYFFLNKKIPVSEYYVRQNDTLRISDHLPLLVRIKVPGL